MEREDKGVGGGGSTEHLQIGGGATGLLTSGEVARLFGVDPKTVSRWADAGKLDSMRTLGGHRRYRLEQVRELLASDSVLD